MEEVQRKTEVKGFFAKLFEKIDKKMEEKSRMGCSCRKLESEGSDKCCSQ